MRANKTTNVIKCIPAYSEVFAPQMILVMIHKGLFGPKLWSGINPHGLVLMAMNVVLLLD